MSAQPVTALEGLRVVELAHERGTFAGKLLADMGAEVIVVEPPVGAAMRSYGPFYKDEPGAEHSLYWWHYNTSKRGVTLDLESPGGRELFSRLVRGADVLIEAEDPGRMAELGLDYPELSAQCAKLVYVSLTPFGRDTPRRSEQATDMTLLAGAGPAWSCGYDDHSLPPVRGGGNQGYHTGCHFAVMSLLVALLSREQTGRGQHIDVNLHAASNVTTEGASYHWLVAQDTFQRQTGRHADKRPTMPTQVLCADGRYVNTGVPPRNAKEFASLLRWLDEEGLRQEFPEAALLEIGAEGEHIDITLVGRDEEVTAIFGAGREAMDLLARRLSAYDFFTRAQQHGLSAGIIYSPEELLDDPHFRARGFPVEVEHPELDASFTYPGAPYRLNSSPWRIRGRAPLLGEHTEEVLTAIGVSPEELSSLRQQGVVSA